MSNIQEKKENNDILERKQKNKDDDILNMSNDDIALFLQEYIDNLKTSFGDKKDSDGIKEEVSNNETNNAELEEEQSDNTDTKQKIICCFGEYQEDFDDEDEFDEDEFDEDEFDADEFDEDEFDEDEFDEDEFDEDEFDEDEFDEDEFDEDEEDFWNEIEYYKDKYEKRSNNSLNDEDYIIKEPESDDIYDIKSNMYYFDESKKVVEYGNLDDIYSEEA